MIRMLFEPIIDNMDPITQWIYLLGYTIFVGIDEVYERFQMVNKQWNVAAIGQWCV